MAGKKSANLFLAILRQKIQQGHCLSVLMKRAQNSDYKTHVRKLKSTEIIVLMILQNRHVQMSEVH